jgi:hypothetical protein
MDEEGFKFVVLLLLSCCVVGGNVPLMPKVTAYGKSKESTKANLVRRGYLLKPQRRQQRTFISSATHTQHIIGTRTLLERAPLMFGTTILIAV